MKACASVTQSLPRLLKRFVLRVIIYLVKFRVDLLGFLFWGKPGPLSSFVLQTFLSKLQQLKWIYPGVAHVKSINPVPCLMQRSPLPSRSCGCRGRHSQTRTLLAALTFQVPTHTKICHICHTPPCLGGGGWEHQQLVLQELLRSYSYTDLVSDHRGICSCLLCSHHCRQIFHFNVEKALCGTQIGRGSSSTQANCHGGTALSF